MSPRRKPRWPALPDASYMVVNEGTPLPLSNADARRAQERLFEESDLLLLVMRRDEDLHVHLLVPPSAEIIATLRRAADDLERLCKGQG